MDIITIASKVVKFVFPFIQKEFSDTKIEDLPVELNSKLSSFWKWLKRFFIEEKQEEIVNKIEAKPNDIANQKLFESFLFLKLQNDTFKNDLIKWLNDLENIDNKYGNKISSITTIGNNNKNFQNFNAGRDNIIKS